MKQNELDTEQKIKETARKIFIYGDDSKIA